MLLRLPYLALTSVFTFIGLVPMSDMDKDIEILTLRHQLAILQRQIDRPRLTPPDRAFLTTLLHRLSLCLPRSTSVLVSAVPAKRGTLGPVLGPVTRPANQR